jgi:hypothetical protein
MSCMFQTFNETRQSEYCHPSYFTRKLTPTGIRKMSQVLFAHKRTKLNSKRTHSTQTVLPKDSETMAPGSSMRCTHKTLTLEWEVTHLGSALFPK